MRNVIVVGGGAAGFFAAIRCAELAPEASVSIFERSPRVLTKVLISGGGRCNVTHACYDPRELVEHYPRGARELLGPFHSFQPADTVDWFDQRGVAIKTEDDGRMFPTSDSSSTIADCLTGAARDAGVRVRTHRGVEALESGDAGFRVHTDDGKSAEAAAVLIGTGGGAKSGGYQLARALGHRIEEPIPSLFTFHISDPLLKDLAGISVPEAQLALDDDSATSSGPLLITHRGLSGPAVLRMSAWSARALHERRFAFSIRVRWLAPSIDVPAVLEQQRREAGARRVVTRCPFSAIPARLWQRMVELAAVPQDLTWARLGRAQHAVLVKLLTEAPLRISGKTMNKDEFVTCGGVALNEVNMKRMESRLMPGLHFAGEVLDIDGITGGFNFQAAWTTGYIAGTAMAERVSA